MNMEIGDFLNKILMHQRETKFAGQVKPVWSVLLSVMRNRWLIGYNMFTNYFIVQFIMRNMFPSCLTEYCNAFRIVLSQVLLYSNEIRKKLYTNNKHYYP